MIGDVCDVVIVRSCEGQTGLEGRRSFEGLYKVESKRDGVNGWMFDDARLIEIQRKKLVLLKLTSPADPPVCMPVFT